MSDYYPDKWVVVKIGTELYMSDPIYKVFASWYGGFAGSDSWKLNSGITKATLEDDVYAFEGSSGSIYHCHKNIYGTNMYGQGVLDQMITNAKARGITMEILDEETNFLELNYV